VLRDVILFTTLVSGLIPAIFVLGKKNYFSPEIFFLKPLFLILAFASFYEVIITLIFKVNTAVWFRIYTLMEFLCILYFFRQLLERKYKMLWNCFLLLFVASFVVLGIEWMVYENRKTDSYLTVIETLLVFAGSVIWFKDIFKYAKLASLWNSPAFYFISGFILYFSGTLFLFLMSDFVFTSKEMSKYWIINVILTLLLNIILLIGIWKGQQKSIRYSG
jgi:hypothetical protein